ncbi:rglC [Symbiodinium sp. CCMP2456]|nr:rglC [Symbiodinium sp. CCMP2456]
MAPVARSFEVPRATSVRRLIESFGKDPWKLKYFLDLKETSPQAAPCVKCPETEESHMLDLLAKMALYAPESWYEIVTGQKCPAEAKNDYPNIGVAFDASSRLRRAGIEWYHNELTTRWMQSHGGVVPFCYLPASLQGATALVETKSWQTVQAEAQASIHLCEDRVRMQVRFWGLFYYNSLWTLRKIMSPRFLDPGQDTFATVGRVPDCAGGGNQRHASLAPPSTEASPRRDDI